MQNIPRTLNVVLIIAVLIALLPFSTSQAKPVNATRSNVSSVTKIRGRKVVADNSDSSLLDQLKAGNATQVVDYGAFSLWQLSDAKQMLNSQRTDFDRIELRSGAFIDTASDSLQNFGALPTALQQKVSSTAQLWLVQFGGPVKSEWLDQLKTLGANPLIYMPANAYVVWADSTALQQLVSLPQVQWNGPYHPAYRVHPALLSTNQKSLPVTVQFYKTDGLTASLERLRKLSNQLYRDTEEILNFVNISLELPASEISNVANWLDVFNIEPWTEEKLFDESQDQIVAGNLTNVGFNTVPITGSQLYLNWLNSKGFPTTPSSYPVVGVIDSGLDSGSPTSGYHSDFKDLNNNPRVQYIVNCTTDALGNDTVGHGTLNAGIVAGYNNGTGAPYQDSNGFRLGLGVSPYGRVGMTKNFRNNTSFNTRNSADVTNCESSDLGLLLATYNAGATMTSNSWGAQTGGTYTTRSQAFDAMTRDANPRAPGNQQMLHIVAAGNYSGPATTTSTIAAPGTSKNVITVGATEGVRDDAMYDGDFISNAGSANNMAFFSGRGPTSDGRMKPDIVAPGTHIQGPASQDPLFATIGNGISGPNPRTAPLYYPKPGQSLYTWSSGTSHATPAVAGAASLVYNYYGRVLNPGRTPSPAMLKALMLNSTRYLSGAYAADNLPGQYQGWGGVNLGTLFDGTPRYLLDQGLTFTSSGQSFVMTGTVADSSKPLRISLVWTDAAGSTTGAAYVNDLNLQVSINGQIYKGNVFNQANSITGGSFDAKNNVENVFLPAGTTGTFTVTVIAANLAGDAVPGTGTTTDQDFALVAYNATVPPKTLLGQAGINYSDQTGNANGYLDSGETIQLNLPIFNSGNLTATVVSASLSSSSSFVNITNPTVSYADIPPGATLTNTTPFSFKLGQLPPCAQPISFTETVNFNNGSSTTFSFSLNSGTPLLGPAVTYSSTDTPKAIPDNISGGVTSLITVTTPALLGKLRVKTNITHPVDGQVIITLFTAQTPNSRLAVQVGGNGSNFVDTVFDDAASQPISAGVAPFTGSYHSNRPLGDFYGEQISGTWAMRVSDVVSGQVGTFDSWSVEIQPLLFSCGQSVAPASGNGQTAQVGTAFGAPLQVLVKDAASNVIPGAVVTFTAPISGASGTFSNGQTVVTATTSANGIASAPTFTANNTSGTFSVTAQLSATGSLTPAFFSLTNGGVACDPLVVTKGTDDNSCGTLRQALFTANANANPLNKTVTFAVTPPFTVTLSGTDLTLGAGVSLIGVCDNTNGPQITLDGQAVAGDGLTLSGSNMLSGLIIRRFGGRQLWTNGAFNQLSCLRLSKY